jgi:predicted AAA+ superfamily ATPase
VAVFSLLPLSLSEIFAYLRPVQKDWQQLCLKGFYPRLFKEKINPSVFYNSYCKTYVEKDVRQILNLHNTRAFMQFLKLCAVRTGAILNTQDIANSAGVDNKTINRWISVLEASYILHLLPPFYNNFDKRIIKKPKIYFFDTGLLCYLLGITTAQQLQQHKLYGSIFENFVINEKLKHYYNKGLSPSFYFWQDSNGREVDLLIEGDGDLQVYEIKSSSTAKADFFKNINQFAAVSGAAGIKSKKHLIYTGSDSYFFDKTNVISWIDLHNAHAFSPTKS